MLFNRLISIRRYKSDSENERGMFLVLVAIMLFTICIFLAILVDIYILLQSQMDMKIAAQMMADGSLRYMTDEKTWLPDRVDPPFDMTSIKSKMMKLAESSYLIGRRSKINFAEMQVFMNDGIYKINKTDNTTSFTNYQFPGTLAERKNPPPGCLSHEICYWAIKVRVETDTDSKIAALFARIIHETETDIKTYGIAYLSTTNGNSVSGYAFEN